MPTPSYYPYRIGQPTVAGGSNLGAVAAEQDPAKAKRDEFMNQMRYRMGLSPLRHPLAMTGGFQSSMDEGRHHGGYSEPPQRIEGYHGAGLPTNLFSQLIDRAPTASDVEMAQGGGLSPNFPQMGSLPYYASPMSLPWNGYDDSQDQQWVKDARRQKPAMPPFPTGPDWNPNTLDTSAPSTAGASLVGPPEDPFRNPKPWDFPDNRVASSSPRSSYLPALDLMHSNINAFLRRVL